MALNMLFQWMITYFSLVAAVISTSETMENDYEVLSRLGEGDSGKACNRWLERLLEAVEQQDAVCDAVVSGDDRFAADCERMQLFLEKDKADYELSCQSPTLPSVAVLLLGDRLSLVVTLAAISIAAYLMLVGLRGCACCGGGGGGHGGCCNRIAHPPQMAPLPPLGLPQMQALPPRMPPPAPPAPPPAIAPAPHPVATPSEESPTQNSAATKIQARWRGKAARKELASDRAARIANEKAKARKKEKDALAKRVKALEDSKRSDAATKIQNQFRGMRTRREVGNMRDNRNQEEERRRREKDIESLRRQMEERQFQKRNVAAIRIQALFRGRRDRQDVDFIREEKERRRIEYVRRKEISAAQEHAIELETEAAKLRQSVEEDIDEEQPGSMSDDEAAAKEEKLKEELLKNKKNADRMLEGETEVASSSSTSSPWAVTTEELERWRSIFAEYDNGSGLIGALEAKKVLEDLGLPTADLSRVWELSDVKDPPDEMSMGEFIGAMALARARQRRVSLPSVLPPELENYVDIGGSGGLATSSAAVSEVDSHARTQIKAEKPRKRGVNVVRGGFRAAGDSEEEEEEEEEEEPNSIKSPELRCMRLDAAFEDPPLTPRVVDDQVTWLLQTPGPTPGSANLPAGVTLFDISRT